MCDATFERMTPSVKCKGVRYIHTYVGRCNTWYLWHLAHAPVPVHRKGFTPNMWNGGGHENGTGLPATYLC